MPKASQTGSNARFIDESSASAGFALSVDMLYHNGHSVTANLDTSMMPTIHDRPRSIAVTAAETLGPTDPYGPRGVGELAIGAIAPASPMPWPA